MCPDHSFQTMTSYLEEVANSHGLAGDTSSLVHSPHTNPRLAVQPQHTYSSPFIQDAYLNSSTSTHSMQRSNTQAPHSSQERIHDHDDHPDEQMEFEYPPYPRSQPSYQGRTTHHSLDHYTASLHPPSGSARPKPDSHITLESLPTDNYQQPRPDTSLLSYREALRGYHNTAQSTILEQQQRRHDSPHDERDQTFFRGRHESPSYGHDDMKDTHDRSAPYQDGIRLITTSSSIPMSNYPSSPPSTGHGLPRFDFESHQNVNLGPNELEDVHGLPDNSRHHHQRHHTHSHVDGDIDNVDPSRKFST